MTEKEEIKALKEKIADLERRLSVVESDTGYLQKQREYQTPIAPFCPNYLNPPWEIT